MRKFAKCNICIENKHITKTNQTYTVLKTRNRQYITHYQHDAKYNPDSS